MARRKYKDIAQIMAVRGAMHQEFLRQAQSGVNVVEFAGIESMSAEIIRRDWYDVVKMVKRSYLEDPLAWVTEYECRIQKDYFDKQAEESRHSVIFSRMESPRHLWRRKASEAFLQSQAREPEREDEREYELDYSEDELRALPFSQLMPYYLQFSKVFGGIPFPEGKDDEWHQENKSWYEFSREILLTKKRILTWNKDISVDDPRYQEYLDNPPIDPEWFDWARKSNCVRWHYEQTYPHAEIIREYVKLFVPGTEEELSMPQDYLDIIGA